MRVPPNPSGPPGTGPAATGPGANSAVNQPTRPEGRVGASQPGTELQRSPPSRPREPAVPAGAPPQAGAPQPWLSLLAQATPARNWKELAGPRALLQGEQATASVRAIGDSLEALQRHLVSETATRNSFMVMSHQVDACIQAEADMPDQVSFIAYADLRVQMATADLRWPPPPPGSASVA